MVMVMMLVMVVHNLAYRRMEVIMTVRTLRSMRFDLTAMAVSALAELCNVRMPVSGTVKRPKHHIDQKANHKANEHFDTQNRQELSYLRTICHKDRNQLV